MHKSCIIIFLAVSISCTTKAEVKTETINRLKNKAVLAKVYCKNNNMNLEMCILVDMKIHSGKKRFFLWDLKGDSIMKAGMCSHGTCGNLSTYDADKTPQFSNTHESHCSSLGKYKLGTRGYSTFGIHINYKLHGLEKTNSNAYKRYIVFHSWGIGVEEIYPQELAESWGCPAVSNNFMEEMDVILKQKKKPLLFWIYN
ncbi:MAG: murein L,D-transpeptidase catalytic domain family protein [Flavobacteriales bacterium]|nr:murein L,D-transpeptidase catalytic domain family protein [Flavobacteriales bacterium]